MYAEERRTAIVELVARNGRVSVQEVADRFGVTTETVRRDLTTLELSGQVRRVHGGAIPAGVRTMSERPLIDRDQTNAEAKDRIALAALTLLPDEGGSLILDAGSTTGRLSDLLPAAGPLTVITNGVPIAHHLATADNIDLHLLPGRVRSTTQAAVGEETVAALRRLRADFAFVGANGVSLGHGLSTPDSSEAATKAQMVRSAHRIVLLADAGKFGRESTVSFAALTDIDVLITDRAAPEALVAEIRRMGVEVVCV